MKLATIIAIALLVALATPASVQPLDRPTFICEDSQASEEANALARLGDREALAIHSRSYGCVLVVPPDFIGAGPWRDRYRSHRRPEAK